MIYVYVYVSASYNQWQEYICGNNICKIVQLKNKKSIFKVHLILVFSMRV